MLLASDGLLEVGFHYIFPVIKLGQELTWQVLSKRRMCKEYLGGIVNNTTAVNSRGNFAFVCTPYFFLRVIALLEPAIQSKNSIWAVVNFQKDTRPR